MRAFLFVHYQQSPKQPEMFILKPLQIITGTVGHCRYNDDVGLEDAVQTAILTLKESFEGQMTEDNIEIGVCNRDGFRRLKPEQVKDYLAQA